MVMHRSRTPTNESKSSRLIRMYVLVPLDRLQRDDINTMTFWRRRSGVIHVLHCVMVICTGRPRFNSLQQIPRVVQDIIMFFF